MSWARFDDRRHSNRKLAAAGLAANGLDANGITYSAQNETDGFIADHVLLSLAPGLTAAKSKALAALLVDCGRWKRDDKLCGWWVCGYLDYNPSHAAMDDKRERERVRKLQQPHDRNGRFRTESVGIRTESTAGVPRIPHHSDAESAMEVTRIPSVPIPSHPVTNKVSRSGSTDAPGNSPRWSPTKEKLLVKRLQALCTGKAFVVRLEAIAFVNHCLTTVDPTLVDEAIGEAEGYPQPPALPRAVEGAVERRAAQHGIVLPKFVPPTSGQSA